MTDGIEMTAKGCESAVQELEDAFVTSLRSVSEYSVSIDQLELVTLQGVWSFERLAPVPIAEFVGTRWTLDGYLDGESVSHDVAMDVAFFELSKDGTVLGATNCRELSGTWIEFRSEVLFTALTVDGNCPDEAAYDLDGRILAVLGDGFRAEIDGDRLTLRSQGNTGLVFRPDS